MLCRSCDKRVVCVIYDEARLCARGLFYVFLKKVIHLHFLPVAPRRVVSGKGSRKLKDSVGNLCGAAGAEHDVGAGDAFGVEPPVPAGRKMMRKLLVLVVVSADIDVEAFGSAIVVRTARGLFGSAFVLAVFVKTQVSAVRKFPADIREVGFILGVGKRFPNGL